MEFPEKFTKYSGKYLKCIRKYQPDLHAFTNKFSACDFCFSISEAKYCYGFLRQVVDDGS